MRENKKPSFKLWILSGIGCILFIIATQPFTVAALAPPPPPLPPTATPAPSTSDAFSGGFIALHIVFPATWPWEDIHWQSLQTHVQWQGQDGTWHNVNGWYGSLDEIVGTGVGFVGHKVWWLPETLLGKGPFRWVIVHEERQIALSEAFYLPTNTGKTTSVVVTLK